MRIDKAVEKLKKELDYKGCRNCKRQIEPLRMCEWAERGGDGNLHFICPWWERREEKMATVNIKDTTEPKLVKLVDLSEDSINEIAEAVVRKIKEQTHWQIPYGGEVVMCEECEFFEEENEYENPYCSRWDNITYAYGFCHEAKRRKERK